MAVNDVSLAELGQVALKEATLAVPAFKAFSTTFRTDLVKFDTAMIPIYSAGSTSSAWNDSTNNYNTANTNLIWRSAILNNHFKVSTDIRDYQNGKVDPMQSIEVMTRKVVRDALADVFGLVTGALLTASNSTAFPNNAASIGFTGLVATFNDTSVNTLASTADTQNWDTNRFLMLNNSYYSQLRKTLYNYNNFGQTDIVKSGTIGNAIGFQTLQVMNLPSNGENLVGVAGDKSCLGVVISTIKPDSDTVEYETATDPDSGLTIGVRKHYDLSLGRMLVSVELLTAKAIGTAMISRLVSA